LLTIDSTSYPLKALAIILFRIVPHAADVECLFSDLSGIQGLCCNNLSVENFEALAKLCSHYNSVLQEKGYLKPRKHAHMHTSETVGINDNTVNSLTQGKETITVSDTALKDSEPGASDPTAAINALQDPAEDPETTTEDDIMRAFEQLNDSNEGWQWTLNLAEGDRVKAVSEYSLIELDSITQGIALLSLAEEITVVSSASGEGNVTWTLESIKMQLSRS
jgi:hypothetical protein